MRARLHVFTLVGCVSFAGACGSKNDDKTQQGKLDNATFAYLCTDKSAGDPYCDTVVSNPKFPSIALGAQFFVGAKAAKNGQPTPVYSSSDLRLAITDTGQPGPDHFSLESAIAHQAGITSILADAGDYVDVRVSPVVKMSITLVAVDAGGKVAATLGPVKASAEFSDKTIFLRAAPLDDGGNELGGALPQTYAWKSSDPTVVSITSPPNAHIITIDQLKAGVSRLTVTLGDVFAYTDVTVKVSGK